MSAKKDKHDRKKLIIPFRAGKFYTQPCGPNCKFKTLLPKGATGRLGIGLISMKGPAWNVLNKHKDWQPVYVLLKGKGKMLIAGRQHAVSAPCVIRIPYNTEHAMQVGRGNHVEYIYINQHLDNVKRQKC